MAHTESDVDSLENPKKNVGGCLRFLNWLTKRLRLVEKGATPPNWRYIGLVYLALFSSASTLTFLLPFLPEMMLTLGYSESNKGTYVGIVASSVFAGRIVGSVFWGWLADRQGRKLVLLITIALNGIFAASFGFANNLIMAVVFRFLCGAVNGTVGTAKTILYDISDNTNQALSMSMLSVAWGMGMIIGPTVGGVLASPAVKWPEVFSEDGLFGHYPYLLPSLFPFVSCFFIFFIIFFKFDETFVVKSSKRTKHELTFPEVEDGDSRAVEQESHHPLLGDMSRKSQSSLLQICQSMHSVHAEAEAAAFLAMETVKDSSSVNKSLLTNRGQSPPGVDSSTTLLDCSEVSKSLTNINEKYQNGTNIHIIAEDAAHISSANASSNNLSYTEFGTTDNSASDDSVHAEAEAAAFLAMETVKDSSSVNKSLLTNRGQSPPGVDSSTTLLDCSEVSKSLTNINEKYQNGTNIHIIAEDAAHISSANASSNNLSYTEFGTTDNSASDDVKNKQNQNNLTEPDTEAVNSSISHVNNSSLIDYNEMKETNHKTVHSVMEDKKNIESRITGAKTEEANERVCSCVERLCSSERFRKYSLFKLLRLSDVWATVMIYTVFSMITIAIEDIFPVFASTRKDYGGLGFSTNEIGLALGAIFLPLLLLQIKIYPYLVSKMGIRKVFLFSAMASMLCCQCIPMVRLLNNRVWLWICLIGIQIPYKIATNCCFAGTSLLINNSVSQELAGQANGLAMMTTAMGRTLAPVLAGLLFSWAVTYGEDIGPPLDISFPFFIIGVLFFVTIFECLHLNPRLDKQKK